MDGFPTNKTIKNYLKQFLKQFFPLRYPLRQVKTKEGCCVDLLAKNFQVTKTGFDVAVGEIAGKKTFAGQPQGGGYRHVLFFFLGMASLIQFIALI